MRYRHTQLQHDRIVEPFTKPVRVVAVGGDPGGQGFGAINFNRGLTEWVFSRIIPFIQHLAIICRCWGVDSQPEQQRQRLHQLALIAPVLRHMYKERHSPFGSAVGRQDRLGEQTARLL